MGSRTIDAQMKAGRELQSKYNLDNRAYRSQALNAGLADHVMMEKMARIRLGRGLGGSLRGERVHAPSARTPVTPPLSEHDTFSLSSAAVSRRTADIGRRGYDTGYLPTRT